MRIRLKNIIALCLSYVLLIVAMFISSIDEAKGGLQVTGSLVLLIIFTMTLLVLYIPFIISSMFERRGVSIAVLIFSIFMEVAIMLPLLINTLVSQQGNGFGRIVMLVFIPLNMIDLLYLIVVNAIFISKHKNELR